MSDKKSTSENAKNQAGSETQDAEILQPERHGARKKPQGPKPTTIDGKASDVTPNTADDVSGQTKGQTKAQSKQQAKTEAGLNDAQHAEASAPASSFEGAAPHGAGWVPPTSLGLVAGLAGGALAAYVLMTVWGEAGSDETALAALDQRIALLDTRLESFDETVSQRLAASDAAQAKQLSALQAELATKSGQGELDARFDRFQSALKGQQDQLAAMQDTLALTGGPVNERLAVLEVQAPKLRADLDLLRAAMPPATLERDVRELSASLTAQQIALGALGPQVSATQKKLVALELEMNKPSGAEQAALGLALANLTRAATDGDPFDTELDAIASLTGDTPTLEALREFGESGVATRLTLEQKFTPMVQAVFAAERNAGTEGFWDRMMASASSVITVRKQGEIDGADTQAVIARMEQRIAVHDLAGAVDQSGLLEGVAKKAAAPWVDTARARLTLDTLLDEASAQLVRSFEANRKDAD
ncbi:MAG: mitofilin family membrane protein [Parvibaculaceae bacterium]|nr:mitofilin family membrane protein [Parvibaculaceae bacterium]